MTITNITSGFRATGIYLFERDAIPDKAFLPNEATLGPVTAESHLSPSSSEDESDGESSLLTASKLPNVWQRSQP